MQHQRPKWLLVTQRNSLLQTPAQTQCWLQRYGNLKLSLNAAEWILGDEVTLGKLPGLYRAIHRFKQAIVEVQLDYATAEHRFEANVEYRLRAYISIPVIIETAYRCFYRILQTRLSATAH